MVAPARPAPAGTRTASGALPFAAAGIGFVVYPAVRPWSDQVPEGFAAAFASPAWLVAHLSAAAAFLLVGFGLLAVRDRARSRAAAAALGLWTVGAALTLTYYGAETFALHALGEQVGLIGDVGLATVTEAIRLGTTQAVVFAVGLVLMAAAAVVLAAVVRPRAVVLPFAAGMVLFLPQFFAGPELRIAHGVLLGAGCLLLARRLSR